MAGPSKAGPALRLLRKGQVERAADMFKKLLQQDPGDVGCLVGLARAQMARKRYDEAQPLLRQVIAQVPDHGEAQSHLAFIDLQGGNAAALDALKRLSLSRKAGFFEFFNAGTALLQRGDEQGAQVALERAKGADQKNPQVRVELGRLHIKRGDYRDAITELQKAVELAPADPLPVLLLSQSFAAIGDPGHGADAVGKALLTQPQSTPLHERMVELGLLAGWPQKAIKSAMALRQIDRMNPNYAYMHGVSMLASGLVAEARHILQDALKKVPRSVAVRQALAQAMQLMGEDAPALVLLEETNQAKPGDAGVASDLAVAYLKSGDAGARAQRVLKRALEEHPAHPVLHFNLALAQARAGDRAGARASAARAGQAPDPALQERAAALLRSLG
ncbi:MAG TPA: tetratricopeptide repeat protein [Myxococcales bacterium]|jgi:predicted Zn-dependent protease|nr:tetratricopeptide repeat protein [Myxococcales bacterium]